SAAIKHFRNQGSRAEDLPLLAWAVEDSLYRMQQAFDILFSNVEAKWLAAILRVLVFPLCRRLVPPGDTLDREAAAVLRQPGDTRDRLTAGMYRSRQAGDRVASLDDALARLVAVAPLEKKLNAARRAGTIPSASMADMLAAAIQAEVLTEAEATQLQEAETAR